MVAVGYKQIIDKFWPRGLAWPRDPSTLQGKLRISLTPEFERLELRIRDLFNEVDPRTTVELLADFERVLGLPDNCGAPPTTLEQRRQAVITKMTAIGGQDKQYFIDLAAAYGFSISIEEYLPFDCERYCDELLYDEPWAYTFKVIAPALTVRDMTCESFCDEYLTTWGNDILECLINRYKPAHLIAIFDYI
jgi:uncharacterized protein YmfQ (DUF2313 family)